MNSVKIIIALASCILISLLAIFLFSKNKEKEMFHQAVEMVMAREGLAKVEEVGEYCPELKNIKQKMDRVGRLNSNIHSLTAGPAPNVSENQRDEIFAMANEIKALRKEIQTELTALMDTYNRSQPTEITGLRF